MTQIANCIKVRIIHFDDEANAASMISNVLFHQYQDQQGSWIVNGSVRRDKRTTRFEIQHGSFPLVEIEYRLIQEVDQFRSALMEIKDSNDLLPYAIVICDVMRAQSRSNNMEAIGLDLYLEARDVVKIPASRLFVLSGFPNYFQEKHPEFHFPRDRLFQKPTPANPFVYHIVRLFPDHIQITI